jgi:hypothetical protein
MLQLSCRALLIAAACLASAAKLHARGTVSPIVATQEVNRCLSVVRAASAAKGGHGCPTTRVRRAGTHDV